MKRVKLRKQFNEPSSSPRKTFVYRPRDPVAVLERIYGKRGARPHIAAMKRAEARSRLVPDTDAGDPIVERLFEDITLARKIERAAWDQLARYLESA